MLRRFLKPAPGDTIVDLGCGSGRSLVWNHASGAAIVGIDVAPYFAQEALERGDLVLGDLRRLPFADGAFGKGYALDVFEHLSREALADVLAEIARVTRPGGHVFVYSHVRKNSWLAGGLKAVNALARQLERVGLVDLRQERLRKSDHLNPLADIPDLERVVGDAGFGIARIRYYTPLIGAFVENILMRMAERALARRGSPAARGALRAERREGAPSTPSGVERLGAEGGASREEEALRAARTSAKRRLAARGPLYYALKGVTALMTLDVWIFGRVRTGPFFVLLERLPSGESARTGRPMIRSRVAIGSPARVGRPVWHRPGGTIHGAGVVAGHSRDRLEPSSVLMVAVAATAAAFWALHATGAWQARSGGRGGAPAGVFGRDGRATASRGAPAE